MAFLQEPERQPFLRVPAATAAVIAALVVAHVARISLTPLQSDAIIDNYAFFPARYSQAFLVAHNAQPESFWARAIPFVSYMFLHANFTHLAINCIWLLPFGAIVARRFGPLLFLAFFLLCGIAGAVAHLVTHWGSMVSAIGASAAISGMMAAGFRMIVSIEAPDMPSFAAAVMNASHAGRPLAPLTNGRLWLWTSVYLVINVLAGLTGLGAGIGTGPQLIAWQAHIGGYLAGLLLAGPFDALARRFRPWVPA